MRYFGMKVKLKVLNLGKFMHILFYVLMEDWRVVNLACLRNFFVRKILSKRSK